MLKYGWWTVDFDITLDGEYVMFKDLSDTSQRYIIACILDGCRQGKIIEETDE